MNRSIFLGVLCFISASWTNARAQARNAFLKENDHTRNEIQIVEYTAVTAETHTKVSKQKAHAELSKLAAQKGAIKVLANRKGIELPEDEVLVAASTAWLRLRKADKEGEISVERVVAAMTDLGRVPINSKPEGADVVVDGVKLYKPTNGHFYMTAGVHTLRLTKSAMRKEQRLNVKAGQNPAVTVTLEAEKD